MKPPRTAVTTPESPPIMDAEPSRPIEGGLHAAMNESPPQAPETPVQQAEEHVTHSTTAHWELDDTSRRWQEFDLLPADYRNRRDTRQTLRNWMTAVLVMIAVSLGSSITLWFRSQQSLRRDAQWIRHAEPLRQLQAQTRQISRLNEQREYKLNRIEAAKPQGRMRQLIIDLAEATQPAPGDPIDSRPRVRSINAKLPVPHSPTDPLAPTDPPSLEVTAVIKNGPSADHWSKRLQHSQRFLDIHFQVIDASRASPTTRSDAFFKDTPPKDHPLDGDLIKLTATPDYVFPTP